MNMYKIVNCVTVLVYLYHLRRRFDCVRTN